MQAAGEAFYPESRAGVETRSNARVWDRAAALALIIALSVGLSTFWAFRVPIFEEPDESAHFDYAISIATAHKLILARDGIPGTDVHPYTRYLEDATNFRGTRYNPDGRAPQGYGTAALLRGLTLECRALLARASRRAAYHISFHGTRSASMLSRRSS